MSMKSCAAAVFLLPLIAGQAHVAQESPSGPNGSQGPLRTAATKEQTVARLESLIPRLMNEGMVAGLGIALVQKGKLVWQGGFGVRNSTTGERITEATVFEAASLSKPVFAYAVLSLVEEGRLDLDAPLTKYMPGNYDVEDDSRLGQITARHVLSHTPGFPNWRGREKALTIHFAPGERFSYSGEGYVYLARVIEHVTGQGLDEFVRKRVFDVIGMGSSSFEWQTSYEARKVFGHNFIGDPTKLAKEFKPNAAASLHTTAGDYGRFLVAMMKGVGLKTGTLKQMLTPQIKLSESGTNNTARAPEKLSPFLSWGLGWGLQTTPDGTAFWHWGDNGDAKAYVVAYEKQRIGVVIFTNSENGLSIIPEIVDEAIGGRQPALAWLRYESHRSPASLLLNSIAVKGAAEALREYRERRKLTGALNEAQVNRLGYRLLYDAKRVKDAIEVFELNVEDYPQSSNTWDSLGEAYMVNGDTELAIKNYERSIELDPANKNGIEMLKKLREKQVK